MTQKRFRKTDGSSAAEAWVEIGWLRYRAELYEDGEFLRRQHGRRPHTDEAEVFLDGKKFSALIRIRPDGEVRCIWSR